MMKEFQRRKKRHLTPSLLEVLCVDVVFYLSQKERERDRRVPFFFLGTKQGTYLSQAWD
jgi:hypothetical protein